MMRLLLILIFSLSLTLLPLSAFAHSETQVIEMTQNGFEPQQVQVDEGSTLIFINKDKQDRWPASNIHPTHEIYPEFDPKKPVEVRQSWSFKPTKAGDWKYHDHLLPHYRGVVTVVAEPASKPTAKPSFFDNIKTTIGSLITKFKNLFKAFGQSSTKIELPSKEYFQKLPPSLQEDEIKKISQSLGAPKAWEYFKEVFKGEAGSSGNIHDLSHLSGILIYNSLGFKGIKQCTPEFSFGCFHGFLDEAFKKDLSQLLDAQNACLKLGPQNSGPVASCIHGIGHGVASFYLTSDLKASLSSCRKLTIGREYCFDGVFMEFVRSAPDSFFKADDPLYPCNALEKDFGPTYSFECGRNQPSLLMGRFKIGFDAVVGICLVSDSKQFREGCVTALGFSLAATQDTEKIIAGCQSISNLQYILECTKAAAGELVFQEVPNWDQKSADICSSLDDSSDECFEHVNRLVADYKRVRKINFLPRQDNEDINAYIRRQLKTCYDINGRDGCYKQVAELLYNQLGFSTTLTALKENENFPEVYARCHEVTHYLSRMEYDKEKNISKVYPQCDSTCHGGCYHGTMEAYLKDQQSQRDFDLNIHFASICGNPQDYQTPVQFNECLHGMGHAAMFVTDMELLQSLKLCDSIPKLGQRERCYTGVFMENSSSSTSFDHASKYVKADDPFYPCNSLEEKYQPLCWQYQSSYFALIKSQDWVKVASMCMQIPTQYQDRCFRTIGTNQVGFTSSTQTMADDCSLMPTQHFQDVCVGGVISSFAYRFVGDAKIMDHFCSLVNFSQKEACFKQMGTSFLEWTLDKDRQEQYCQHVTDPQGLNWCLSALKNG